LKINKNFLKNLKNNKNEHKSSKTQINNKRIQQKSKRRKWLSINATLYNKGMPNIYKINKYRLNRHI